MLANRMLSTTPTALTMAAWAGASPIWPRVAELSVSGTSISVAGAHCSTPTMRPDTVRAETTRNQWRSTSRLLRRSAPSGPWRSRTMAGIYIDQRPRKYVGRPNGVASTINHLTQVLRADGFSHHASTATTASGAPTTPKPVTTNRPRPSAASAVRASRSTTLANRTAQYRRSAPTYTAGSRGSLPRRYTSVATTLAELQSSRNSIEIRLSASSRPASRPSAAVWARRPLWISARLTVRPNAPLALSHTLTRPGGRRATALMMAKLTQRWRKSWMLSSRTSPKARTRR